MPSTAAKDVSLAGESVGVSELLIAIVFIRGGTGWNSARSVDPEAFWGTALVSFGLASSSNR